jgi:hypothetical protein
MPMQGTYMPMPESMFVKGQCQKVCLPMPMQDHKCKCREPKCKCQKVCLPRANARKYVCQCQCREHKCKCQKICFPIAFTCSFNMGTQMPMPDKIFARRRRVSMPMNSTSRQVSKSSNNLNIAEQGDMSKGKQRQQLAALAFVDATCASPNVEEDLSGTQLIAHWPIPIYVNACTTIYV